MKLVLPKNSVLVGGWLCGWSLLRLAFHLAHTKGRSLLSGGFIPVIILTNFRTHHWDLHPYLKEEAIPGEHSVEGLVESPRLLLPPDSRIPAHKCSKRGLWDAPHLLPHIARPPAPRGLNTGFALSAEYLTCKAHWAHPFPVLNEFSWA